MANVNIRFNGKDYLLFCDDGQEKHLQELTKYLNEKFQSLKTELGNIGENKLLLISSIKTVDEYYEIKKKVEEKKENFNFLSRRFKELKSLVIQYKKEKDEEIERLNKELSEFKEMVDKNKQDYEKIIDKATKSIEEFISKSSQDNSIQ
tara:strand:+ start:104 stop:550 length:447 start_codon:yes stop_codon:yes gene_type:complete